MSPVENGIPQGSPISPILAAFYSAELLELFPPTATPHRNPMPDKPTTISMLMYVDDGKLYVSSESLDTNILLLHTAYKKAEKWMGEAGLAPDFSKRELMHYTRRRSDESPSMVFNDSDGTRRTVTPESTVRWLGVHFDRKLRFNQHVELAATRGENAVNGITMLANTVKGLHQSLIRRLYISCVIPKMLYACPLWYNQTAKQLKPLAKVQRRALHLMCAAFRTTPTQALEIEASIPPIHLQIKKHIKLCAIRFNKLGPNNPIIQRLPDNWRNGNAATTPPPLQQRLNTNSATDGKRTTPLLDIAKFTSASHERIDPFLIPSWRTTAISYGDRVTIRPHDPKTEDDRRERGELRDDAASRHTKLTDELKRSASNLVVYTDGSLVKRGGFARAGAGVVMYHKGQEVGSGMVGLGGKAEVYDAEMAALWKGSKMATHFARAHPEIQHIHFFADNTSAVRSAFDPKPCSGQLYAATFHNKLQCFLDDDESHKLTIAWCPGHTDVKGNERADELAKEATNLQWNAPIGTSRSNAIRWVRQTTGRQWVREWRNTEKTGGFAISNRIPPQLKPTKRFLSTPRELFGRVIQCRTGHAYIGEFRRRFFPEEDQSCPCGEPFQTREHVLRTCVQHTAQRGNLTRISRDIFIADILGTGPGITALTDFIRAGNAFTMLGHPPKRPTIPSFEDEPEPADDTP